MLATVHKVLISGAILADLAYALRAVVMYRQSGESVELLKSLAAIVVAVALGAYLKRFRKKLRASAGDPPPDAEPATAGSGTDA
jgi:membrane protein DedA with SNARE-associated domain